MVTSSHYIIMSWLGRLKRDIDNFITTSLVSSIKCEPSAIFIHFLRLNKTIACRSSTTMHSSPSSTGASTLSNNYLDRLRPVDATSLPLNVPKYAAPFRATGSA